MRFNSIETSGEIWAIEIKLTSSPKPEDFARLKKNAELIGAKRMYLVSNIAQSTGDHRIASCNLPELLERISR